MNCPRCNRPLLPSVEWVYSSRLGREERIAYGYDECEDCAQDAALDRMRERTPWLFRQDGAVDEHDVMQEMERRGEDGWPVRR